MHEANLSLNLRNENGLKKTLMKLKARKTKTGNHFAVSEVCLEMSGKVVDDGRETPSAMWISANMCHPFASSCAVAASSKSLKPFLNQSKLCIL